jgi:hypothetical protein
MNIPSRREARGVGHIRSLIVSLAAGTLITGIAIVGAAIPAGATNSTPPVPTMTITPSSGAVGIGGKIFATVTVTGNHPTGSILFTLFPPSDSGCVALRKPLFTSTETLVNGSATSRSYTTTQMGTYTWVAYYSGDKNNSSNSTTCTAGKVTISALADSIRTVPSSSVTAGGTVSDTAYVSGTKTLTGTVTFNLYGPSDSSCESTPVSTTVGTIHDGKATSGDVVLNALGSYYWVASYSGDSNNLPTTSICGSEEVSVTLANPSIRTVPSGTVGMGGSVYDRAILSGGANPSGTITFDLFGPSNSTCAGTAIDTDTEPVSGGSATSISFVVNAAGTYNWEASYSGDTNNDPVSSPCSSETVSVTKATPTITTQTSGLTIIGNPISDTAFVSGGFDPTGSVTFTLYGPADPTCKHAVVSTTSGDLSGGEATSGSVLVGAGTYEWVATYTGDSNNNVVSSPCGSESQVVSKAIPAISTTDDGNVPNGSTISDEAFVSGGNSPTGTVTFALYGPTKPNCTGTPVSTSTGTLSGGDASSADVVVSDPGTYNWVATYNGDANNASSVSGCGEETFTVTGQTLTGESYAVGLNGTVLGIPVGPTYVQDTGPVSTTQKTSTPVPCLVNAAVPDLLLTGDVCAAVDTTTNPEQSAASASVANAGLLLGPAAEAVLPTITIQGVASTSTTTCAGSTGSTTIAFLQIGSDVIISHDTVIPQNDVINLAGQPGLSGVTLILNQQTPYSDGDGDSGQTVNAINLTVNIGIVDINLIVASSQSDIGNCPGSDS